VTVFKRRKGTKCRRKDCRDSPPQKKHARIADTTHNDSIGGSHGMFGVKIDVTGNVLLYARYN